MKKIKLNNDQFAIIDDQDFKLVNQFKWTYRKPGYAHKHIPKTYSDTISMHRLIMNAPKGKEVDHINGDKLDNRKSNLRFCTRKQNGKNKGFSKNNTSGFKGVYWHRTKYKNKISGYWAARIACEGKKYVKYFKNKLEAAHAYNELAKKYHGEFALLNKI